eukprot:5835279-Amphidinium_carterae.1
MWVLVVDQPFILKISSTALPSMLAKVDFVFGPNRLSKIRSRLKQSFGPVIPCLGNTSLSKR